MAFAYRGGWKWTKWLWGVSLAGGGGGRGAEAGVSCESRLRIVLFVWWKGGPVLFPCCVFFVFVFVMPTMCLDVGLIGSL